MSILPAGTWGGEQVRFDVGAHQAVLKLGCADAYLPGPIRLDAHGRFDVQGHYASSAAGPAVATETLPKNETRFEGQVMGDRLMLTVHRAGASDQYVLLRGVTSKVIGCY